MQKSLYILLILNLCFNYISLSQNNVGIGTNNPTAQLHTTGTVRFQGVSNDNNQTQLLTNDATGNLSYRHLSSLPVWFLNGNAGTNSTNDFIGTTDNTKLIFRTNNTERFTILANGNSGIGISNPGTLLQIQNNSLDNNIFLTGNSPSLRLFQSDWNSSAARARLGLATGFGHFVTTSSPSDFILQNVSPTGSIIFGTNETVPFAGNGLERMRITSNGLVGIGTTSPSSRLHINCALTAGQSNPSNIRLENLQTGNGNILVVDANGYVFQTNLAAAPTLNNQTVADLKAEVELLKKEIEELRKIVLNKTN